MLGKVIASVAIVWLAWHIAREVWSLHQRRYHTRNPSWPGHLTLSLLGIAAAAAFIEGAVWL